METQKLLSSIEHLMQIHQPVKISTHQSGLSNSSEHSFVIEYNYGKPLVLTIACHISLDLDALRGKLTSLASHLVPYVTEEDLCLFLSKSIINVFPYLKSHNQLETDYASLAELYRDYRGLIQTQSFGI